MEGQMEGKRVVVLASHFVRGQWFLFVSHCLCSWVVVLVGGQSFSLVGGHLRAWVRGHVLGAHDSRVRVIVIHVVVCGHGYCPWGWVIICGGRHCLCGRLWSWLLYLGLGYRLWAPCCLGGARLWAVTLFMAGG